jgi:hypothetical protein
MKSFKQEPSHHIETCELQFIDIPSFKKLMECILFQNQMRNVRWRKMNE